MNITRVGSQASQQGGAENFTGQVRRDPLFYLEAPGNMGASQVTFEPGARTRWHTHPTSQVLIVTSGCGLVQERGGTAAIVYPGDVVVCSPDIPHWHGATEKTSLTHIAINERKDGVAVVWHEPVTDEDYAGAAAAAQGR